MSTLHKVKAYFGMAPLEDYEDEYYDDDRSSRGGYGRRGDSYDRGERYEADYDHDPRDRREPEYASAGYRGGYDEDPRYGRDYDHPAPAQRFAPLRGGGSTRGALAMDPRRMQQMFDEGSALAKITTLRPKDYSEARTIGERFRDGTPVIMDLVTMDNADAKRLVDFAAGLAFALRGSFDKVATKVFLLSPADVEVTPEQRRRMADGFYGNQ